MACIYRVRSMLRDAITMLVAFAVTLFALDPTVSAQTGWPTVAQSQAAQDSNPAQDPAQAQPDSDGQSTPQQDAAADEQHAIARLSVAQGDVNVSRGDSNGELSAAAVNAPLATQDHLQTSDGSRAEVELDSANLVRLAPNTELGFADLEYRRYQLQLGAGTIIFRVLRNSSAQVEVDTPSVGFRPLSEGEFLLSVLSDGTTQITARSGQGEIFGPRGSQQLPAAQTLVIRGNPSDPEFREDPEVARGQFDEWSEQRDSQLLGSQSYRYVSQDIPGADDLDQYGNWVPSQYGQVWAPQSEPAGWSPYSTGEWAWQGYYGWTWVDSAPWGWAPYHYGRWFNNGGYGWCWWPGAVRSSYFWSPALVGFFGWGGFGLGLALGGLGWVALAPFEGLHRWWGPGWYRRGWGAYGRGFPAYGRFARNVDVARMYRNAAFRGGAMTARYNGFGGPNQRFAAATHGQLMNASSFRGGRMPITPTRESYHFSARSAASNPRLTSAANQRFFRGSQFGARSYGGVQNNASGFGTPRGMSSNRSQGYAARDGGGQTNRQSSGGWQRFGDPGNTGALRQSFTGGSERSGWHTFGQPQRAPGHSSYSGGQGNSNQYRYNGGNSPGRSSSPSYSGQRYSAPRYNAPSYSAPQQHYSAPQQHYSAPQQHYSAPQQHYSAPQQHYSAPQQHYSAPHYSAPSTHSFGGGESYHGGGSSHPSGGGHSGGGGNHGGGGGHSGGGHH